VETTHRKVSSVSEKMNFEGRELRLPGDQELTLKVLEGEEKGTVYPLKKPRITIGRENADISINDRSTSRIHCALEVGAKGVVLRDLDSTNGTLVNDVPVEMVELTSGSTFRVGSHLFQLEISPKPA
jgi:pSer/pThr/pTyr-binding forkhead associated (FHA) protein